MKSGCERGDLQPQEVVPSSRMQLKLPLLPWPAVYSQCRYDVHPVQLLRLCFLPLADMSTDR